MCSKPKLGFKYPWASQTFVDAEEYLKLLPKLKEGEAQYLKQFLLEYYGRPSKEDLVIHSLEHYPKINGANYAQKNDVAAQSLSATPRPRKKKGYKAYSPSDYCQSPPTPLELFELAELESDLREIKKM